MAFGSLGSLLYRAATAAVGAVTLSVIAASSSEAATINSFKFDFSGNGGNQPSYVFTKGNVSVTATASTDAGIFGTIDAYVSQTQKGLGVDFGLFDGGKIDGAFGRDVLNLAFSRSVQLSSAFFTLVDRRDEAVIRVDGTTLFNSNLPLNGLVSFADNDGISFDFGATDYNDNFRLRGVEVYNYADGTAVPEPLTILATVIGGSAVLGMRKKLSPSDSSANS
ncbi:PEP-CTERM putative exosortase interaction domain protein [Synechococcus sp. PCC 7335]|uniref:PEP-CTERM sorting domain-containing protein n=1 Tax=Synechococcus sp. (strain ATCC 29403 / PCC 7335) TaxID=91464 RepID=UPI00017ED288|nr:PEP-CTERM sorting domain-containing protein [Synechococcus sp. PCC 7335]EDX87041.1 PEP-CTERM putative exosortase interaction domain protein [Synechococcus sp. PCC 7335]